LGLLKPAIAETDVHLSHLPQSLSEITSQYRASFNAELREEEPVLTTHFLAYALFEKWSQAAVIDDRRSAFKGNEANFRTYCARDCLAHDLFLLLY
jgi:hypothetical protein